jgi:hypothetical protein
MWIALGKPLRPVIATHPVGEAEGDTQGCNVAPVDLHHVNARNQPPTLARTYNGPKIVVLLQGLHLPDGGSGKLTEVGIFSGSLVRWFRLGEQIYWEIPYSEVGLEGLIGRDCSS